MRLNVNQSRTPAEGLEEQLPWQQIIGRRDGKYVQVNQSFATCYQLFRCAILAESGQTLRDCESLNHARTISLGRSYRNSPAHLPERL